MVQPDRVHEILREYTIGDGEKLVIDLNSSFGSHIVDARTGDMFLDCDSQFASLPLGWNHPRLVDECESGSLGALACVKVANSDYYTHHLADFVQKFASIAPDFTYFFFIEGGALGVENALKAAIDWKMRKHNLDESSANQIDIIHLEQGFHGRSGYALSLTNTCPKKVALFPKFTWTRIKNPKIEYPLVDSEVATLEAFSLQQAENALKTNRVAAIILEPIQGEGGDNHFTSRYFAALRQLANQYEAMLIFDEVQTGVGLTGKMWAYEHFGVIPDMICFGKKAQVCGFASTTRIDEVADNVFKRSSRINSTWGGNLVDMVRFITIADVIQRDNLLNRVKTVGDYFLEKLHRVRRITNIRGRGLMIAFDLEDTYERNKILRKMKERMTILPCGERSIRLRPALIFSQADVDEAIEIIEHVV